MTQSDQANQDVRLPINRYVLFFGILAVGLAIDLWTKHWAFTNHFDPNNLGQAPEWWIDQVFGVQTSTNGGALFGMGQGGSMWFAGFSVLAFAAVLYWLFLRKYAHSLWLTVTLAMVSGGICGNFYDRVGWGYRSDWNLPEIRNHVRDWIHFRWEGIQIFDPWPNFNIADSLLVCGAIMLFFFALFGNPQVHPGEEAAESESASDSSSKSNV